MGFNLDLTEARLLAKTIFVKSKRTLDRLTDGYNNFFESNIEDAKALYQEAANKLRDKGDYEGAIKAYLKLLEMDPSNIAGLCELGKVYMRVGLIAEAIDVLEQAATVDRNSAHIFYQLGSAYYMSDKNAEAMRALNEAIRLDPNFADAHYKLGLVYDSAGDHDKAIEAYTKVIAINPDHIKAYQSLGLAYESKGQRDEAVKYFKRALEKEEKRI